MSSCRLSVEPVCPPYLGSDPTGIQRSCQTRAEVPRRHRTLRLRKTTPPQPGSAEGAKSPAERILAPSASTTVPTAEAAVPNASATSTAEAAGNVPASPIAVATPAVAIAAAVAVISTAPASSIPSATDYDPAVGIGTRIVRIVAAGIVGVRRRRNVPVWSNADSNCHLRARLGGRS